ncbi:MAG: SPASM domain-containing protein, partial [Lentisphaeria bacterium]
GELYAEGYRRQAPVRINMFDGKIKVRIRDGYDPCDKCGFGLDEVAVAPGGNLYPCERIVGDDTNTALCLGNVFDGFDEAKRMKVAACRGNTVAECADCPVRERCMNWCGCINYATTGAANRVAGIVCFHERLAIEAADRVAAALYAERNPAFISRFYGGRHSATPNN